MDFIRIGSFPDQNQLNTRIDVLDVVPLTATQSLDLGQSSSI